MHIVPFKLKENAREFKAGEYTGFGIRTGEKHQEKGQDVWTNYETAIFAKSPAQIDFYRSNLVAGALVVVTADKQAVSLYEWQNGVVPAIKLINANVKAVQSGSAQTTQPRDARQPAPQSAPPANNGFDGFDDPDIPF